MSSRAGGLYGGIQFSSTKAFASTQAPATPAPAPISEKPATTFTAAPTDPAAQNAPAPAGSATGEPSASAKATAGILPL